MVKENWIELESSGDWVKIIGSGKHCRYGSYSILDLCGCRRIRYVNWSQDFESQKMAYVKAKEMGCGREPMWHRPHKPGDKYHYHISNHYYIRFDTNPDVILNMHFRHENEMISMTKLQTDG